jgi:hypothetical protein
LSHFKPISSLWTDFRETTQQNFMKIRLVEAALLDADKQKDGLT